MKKTNFRFLCVDKLRSKDGKIYVNQTEAAAMMEIAYQLKRIADKLNT